MAFATLSRHEGRRAAARVRRRRPGRAALGKTVLKALERKPARAARKGFRAVPARIAARLRLTSTGVSTGSARCPVMSVRYEPQVRPKVCTRPLTRQAEPVCVLCSVTSSRVMSMIPRSGSQRANDTVPVVGHGPYRWCGER